MLKKLNKDIFININNMNSISNSLSNSKDTLPYSKDTLPYINSVGKGTLQIPHSSIRQNVSLPSSTKKSLLQKIDILKNEIECLVKLNKTQITNEERKKNVNLKQQKMTELKKSNEDLKIIYRNERLESIKNNRILAVQKTMDNLDFRSAKQKKNDSEAMDRAKKAKEQRELLRKTYIESKEVEKIYLEKDSKLLPGNLFLNENIIKKYGLCPFININEDSENIYTKRLEWLTSRDDNGTYYYKLYKDFFERESINILEQTKQNIEDSIEEFIKKILSESQIEIYNDSITFLKEYIACHIKSKRIKERYKGFINNMSILYSETSLLLHEYLSFKYNIHIVINDIYNQKSSIQDEHSKKTEQMYKVLYIEEFDKLVYKYDDTIKSLEQNIKFVNNTIINLNSNLYSYLTDNEDFLKQIGILHVKNKSNQKEVIIKREGKYFKKWTSLSNEERLERFLDFSKYFVTKNIQLESSEEMVSKLYNLLKDNFLQKKIVYRNCIWNIKLGIIENVKILIYNNDTNEFILNNTTENNTTETSRQGVKKISTKTIITKHVEKIINEELLYFIVKKLKDLDKFDKETDLDKFDKEDVNTINQKNKEDFIDNIKEKLCVKKINKNDKEIIYKTYDNIYEIIANNKK